MADEYLTPEEARARYIEEHNLSGFDEQTLDQLVPKFPKGTREYAEYAEQLSTALDEFRRGAVVTPRWRRLLIAPCGVHGAVRNRSRSKWADRRRTAEERIRAARIAADREGLRR